AAGPQSQRRPTPDIAGLEIRNGVVDYIDEATGLSINASNLELDMGAWRAGRPLPVHTRLLLKGGSLPPSGVWVEVDSPALGVAIQPLRVQAPRLAIRVANAEINGNLTYEQAADGLVNARGAINAHVPSLRKLAADLALNQ